MSGKALAVRVASLYHLPTARFANVEARYAQHLCQEKDKATAKERQFTTYFNLET